MPLLLDAEALQDRLDVLAGRLRACQWRVCTAESCTGGLIAALCTSIAGSSDWFDRGFVTYSNQAKSEQLGVPATLIQQHGAVSRQVAEEMARGALRHSAAQLAVAVTGIAGPGGAVAGKPVGTVWLALAWTVEVHGAAGVRSECLQCPGDRTAVRSATVAMALTRLLEAVG